MKIKKMIIKIIEELTDEHMSENLALNLYDEGLVDSMATGQMLVEIDGRLEITVPVSEYERSAWGTPHQIIEKIPALQ